MKRGSFVMGGISGDGNHLVILLDSGCVRLVWRGSRDLARWSWHHVEVPPCGKQKPEVYLPIVKWVASLAYHVATIEHM